MSFESAAPPSRPPLAGSAQDLNDDEFLELDDLLASVPEPLEPLDVVMLDGYLCGVIVQPVLIPSDDWLPFVFDAGGHRWGEAEPGPEQQRARALILRRHEAVGVDRVRGVAAPVVGERRERNAAALAQCSRTGAIGDDPVEPRAQQRATLEALDARDHGEPRLLQDVLGGRVAMHERPRVAQQRRAVPAHELGERRLVAGAQPGEQGAVGVSGKRGVVCHRGAPSR